MRINNFKIWLITIIMAATASTAWSQDNNPSSLKDAINTPVIKDNKHRNEIANRQVSVATELYGWLGKDPDDLNIAFTNTLGGTATLLVYDAHAISLSASGSVPFLDQTKIILRPLSPAFNTKSALIWKRTAVQTEAAKKFIEFVSSIPGMEGAVAE